MFARVIEKVMNLLLSALMVAFFIILAPIWTLVYSGVLLKDYLSVARI
jgi:hypothetical protein